MREWRKEKEWVEDRGRDLAKGEREGVEEKENGEKNREMGEKTYQSKSVF